MPTTSDDLADPPIGFGPFQLYPTARILKNDLDTVNIGGRAFDLLLALVRRPNEVVTKRELFELVWPNVNVDDGNLRIQINNLRKTLGDGKGEANYIRNVAGRGYCFVGTLTTILPEAEREKAEQSLDVAFPFLPPKITGPDEGVHHVG